MSADIEHQGAVMNPRIFTSARLRCCPALPRGFTPGERVRVRWVNQDGRGRDWYALSHTDEFTGYSPVFCARWLEDFSTDGRILIKEQAA